MARWALDGPDVQTCPPPVPGRGALSKQYLRGVDGPAAARPTTGSLFPACDFSSKRACTALPRAPVRRRQVSSDVSPFDSGQALRSDTTHGAAVQQVVLLLLFTAAAGAQPSIPRPSDEPVSARGVRPLSEPYPVQDYSGAVGRARDATHHATPACVRAHGARSYGAGGGRQIRPGIWRAFVMGCQSCSTRRTPTAACRA